MSAPDIAVSLDPGPWDDPQWRDYRATNGTVSGTVHVNSAESLPCRGVRVSIGWETEGRGDHDGQMIADEVVHAGELVAGRHEFPFQAELPEGPISYQGHHIKILWKVSARIDLAWKRDPASESVFYVTIP